MTERMIKKKRPDKRSAPEPNRKLAGRSKHTRRNFIATNEYNDSVWNNVQFHAAQNGDGLEPEPCRTKNKLLKTVNYT